MNTLGKLIALVALLASATGGTYAAVVDDPLVRMPGTQPGEATLESPNRCLNCHAGYNQAVEPGFNWKGSMMAHAARDFLFFSCLTVAAQDSIWALGTPNAVDICERCHFPKGWLEGRSDPPNASAMTGADYDGVQCDFCHQLWDPHFQAVHAGSREGSDWQGYWDETNASATPSDAEAEATFLEDSALAQSIVQFNGASFFANGEPPAGYSESAAGQYFVSPGGQKRASFADAAARHQMFYSRYHKSKYFCSTCHDVSNPVFANLDADPAQSLPTETLPAHSYSHVERTFSEFMLSAYGQQGGAATNPEFQAQGAPGITKAAKCQDCHMRDVVGAGANKNGVPVRPGESVEHPASGQPLHDFTGGNMWVSWVLASSVPGTDQYNATNAGLLNQGPAALTLDLTQGQGIDPVALLAGVERARQQLLLAATIKNLSYDKATGELAFRIQNNTGHKLISGFPEGRRMFVNIRAYDAAGATIFEVNPYDEVAGTLKGLDYSYLGQGLRGPDPLAGNEAYVDELVYEMHPSSTRTGESETFHFALADGRHKDNRIPPKGFDIANAAGRLSVPVYYRDGTDEGRNYFSDLEYAGGYDEITLSGILPAGAEEVKINLYYQTTSREYIEFLRDEIKGTGNLTLPSGAYIAQSDAFFDQLRAWGDTIWQLWLGNKDKPGAAPFLMASAAQGGAPVCSLAAPTLLSAIPGNGSVDLSWSDVSAATGYNLYYDQAGKAQLVADAVSQTTYPDTGLTNGQEYCYKVTAHDGSCESAFSNILCAIPQNPGQVSTAGVVQMETGYWSGKGKNRTFVTADSFAAGDAVVIRALVSDDTVPVTDAVVEMEIAVVDGAAAASLSSGPSDGDGWAEATWQTQKPPKKGQGGTAAGSYTATTVNVTAAGYVWDETRTGVGFTIQ